MKNDDDIDDDADNSDNDSIATIIKITLKTAILNFCHQHVVL